MIMLAHAKINLTLDITRKRSDGYHDISSVMQTLTLTDEVEMTKNKKGAISVGCNRRDVPVDERNTAYRAAKAILDYSGISDMGVNIFIDKSIPLQAGLGGGSADAAAVLRGMNRLFRLEITDRVLMEIAAQVGADVPFCLAGGTCLCEGIGDIVTPVEPLPECTILICKPPVGVATAEAYTESDKYPQDGNYMTLAMLDALRSGNIRHIAEYISNRFDDVLHIPEVQVIKSIMNEYGALGSCMTGTGSAVYGVYSDDRAAINTAEILRNYGEVFLTSPVPQSGI